MGYYQQVEHQNQSFERNVLVISCSRVFLDWVLKSGKMIGGQILCSFFVSDDNIEFLEQKDPPHQSWLSILLSEEILYSRNGRHGFTGIVNGWKKLLFLLPKIAPIAKSLASQFVRWAVHSRGAIKSEPQFNFTFKGIKGFDTIF
ncbi:hypothetical protein Tco_1085228 [Tanacetum coccineum]